MQQLQSDGSYNELYPKTDAWTKDETLSAQVASVLGLRDNYKPDDAFLGLYFGAGTYRYRVRVVLDDGTPVQGSTISGISAIQGQSLVTNEQGYVLGKSTSQSVTISCTSPFVDQKIPDSQTISSTGIVTDCVLKLINIEDIIKITSSSTYVCSTLVKSVDIGTVGGGGGGGSYSGNGQGGGGGAGGNVDFLLNKFLSNHSISIQIGARGLVDGTGRTTTVTVSGETILSSTGGAKRAISNNIQQAPAYGNGNGGLGRYGGTYETYQGTSGTSSSIYLFNDTSLFLAGGGGGGGGAFSNTQTQNNGGLPYGRGGAMRTYDSQSDKNTTSSAGTGFGGGGGGAVKYMTASKGADGGVYLRFHF